MRNTRTARRRAHSGNRTRTIFFVFLAIILGLIAFSLSSQIIDSAVLLQMYIAASVLAVGVVGIDMLGLLGAHQGDEGGAYDPDGGHEGGHDGGYDAAANGGDGFGDDAYGADASGVDESVRLSDTSGVDGGSVDGASIHGENSTDDHVPLHDVEHDSVFIGQGPVLEAIRYLRMFVYFCLGFGLIGLAMLTSGSTAQASFLFACIAGIGSVMLARTFYRLQPRDTGDVLSENELLMERGIVLVPLSHTTMGKVRVQIGMQVHEPYALSAHTEETFTRGDSVKIVEVTEKCVYVEEV